MSQISVNHLTFYYDGSGDTIFEDVSFRIDTDWRLGFVARNGRGKTTFLNLLRGKYEYRGSISASVEFDYFPFEIADREKNTLEVIEGIYPGYEFWKVCRELTLLQVEMDVLYRPFSTLSNGEQTKVMLAVLFSGENHFLLIDEPTNHLDMETREMIGTYLNRKKGFILVSHDRTFLDKCIDHVLSINKMDIEVQQGNFSSWMENKRRQDEFEAAENERLKKDIRRMTEAAGQARQWADRVEGTKIGRKSEVHEKCIDTRAYIGEKSRRMQMRRRNLERRQNRAIEEKSGLLKNIETAGELKLFPLRHYKETLLHLEHVGLFYEKDICAGQKPYMEDMDFIKEKQRTERGDGSRQIVEGFRLEIKNGDKAVLSGRNGCGKSSVLKAILRKAEPGPETENGPYFMRISGELHIAVGLRISYVPQDTAHLRGSLTDYAAGYGIDETLFKALLCKLDFSRPQFDKKLEEYSGGQKKKVLIARSLCEQAHLYIWDEPLNFVDVFSRMQIEALIRKYNPTLIMVEHDRAFMEEIGARIITM